MPEPVKLMIARFPGGNSETPDCCDWITTTVIEAKQDSRISKIIRWRRDTTPITMARNECMEVAKKEGADFVLMLDSDMKPDAYLESNPYRLDTDANASAFFPDAFDFLWQKRQEGKPSIIGAPYCGPPPHENIYVFHWCNYESNLPSPTDLNLQQYTREHASVMSGIKEVAALPTGLILIDTRVLDNLEPPYFYYEWEDNKKAKKASTEDVTFTRDSSLMGCPQYCHWNAWAGHWKWKCVGRPVVIHPDNVKEVFKKAVLRGAGIDSPTQELLDWSPEIARGEDEDRIVERISRQLKEPGNGKKTPERDPGTGGPVGHDDHGPRRSTKEAYSRND
jgi:hypothetical protein